MRDIPLPDRKRSLPWEAFVGGGDRWRADPELASELAELLRETTDDLQLP